jgi:hypothetical protein
MTMTYDTLVGSKTQSGSIALWTNYTKLDIPTIIDEAQALLYSEGRLRAREMTTDLVFTGQVGTSVYPLPARFLDPIGRIKVNSFNNFIRHIDPGALEGRRIYTETTGSLGPNPFTTVTGSNTVSVFLAGHGFAQDSEIALTGATAFNGVTINGTFPVTAITDANDFTIDITILGTTPTGSGSGGGSGITYICDSLISGTPLYYSIWNEQLKFDQAFFQESLCRLQYYQSAPLLATGSPQNSNFLTTRYPQMMRVACMAAAADFMKDTEEYNKQFQRLTTMIEKISIENDMHYRGMELEADTP